MIIKGDINGDGKIDIIDREIVRAHILGLITLSDDEFIAADIDDDGVIDIIDFTQLRLFSNLFYNTINEVIY